MAGLHLVMSIVVVQVRAMEGRGPLLLLGRPVAYHALFLLGNAFSEGCYYFRSSWSKNRKKDQSRLIAL